MFGQLKLQERCKPRLEAVLFADRGKVTTDGKIVLYDIFNRITVEPEFKGASIACELFVRTVETVQEPVQIKLTDPNGGVVVEGPGDDPVWLVGETPWPRHLQTLRRVILTPTEEGLYLVEITYKGQRLGGTHLIVEFRKLEEPTFH